jgi:hypothetical protein
MNKVEKMNEFDCEDCKKTVHMDDVMGRVTYVNGLYGFWCGVCWSVRKGWEKR